MAELPDCRSKNNIVPTFRRMGVDCNFQHGLDNRMRVWALD